MVNLQYCVSLKYIAKWLLYIYFFLFLSLLHLSVQFSHSVMSDSLQPHELQHIRLLCASLSPGVCSNSCPLSRWCHPTISSSVVPFSAFNLSQHQSIFQWVSSLYQVTKGLELQFQHQSFQWRPIKSATPTPGSQISPNLKLSNRLNLCFSKFVLGSASPENFLGRHTLRT